uniref:Uncharacterized protein n=1 Tax=Romanomermis culicivorax TaxID=13658 RepID=A0A915JHR4_ROMCU
MIAPCRARICEINRNRLKKIQKHDRRVIFHVFIDRFATHVMKKRALTGRDGQIGHCEGLEIMIRHSSLIRCLDTMHVRRAFQEDSRLSYDFEILDIRMWFDNDLSTWHCGSIENLIKKNDPERVSKATFRGSMSPGSNLYFGRCAFTGLAGDFLPQNFTDSPRPRGTVT